MVDCPSRSGMQRDAERNVLAISLDRWYIESAREASKRKETHQILRGAGTMSSCSQKILM
jgi:hypothetical protein